MSSEKKVSDGRGQSLTPSRALAWFDDHGELVADQAGNLSVISRKGKQIPFPASKLGNWMLGEMIEQGLNPSRETIQKAVITIVNRAERDGVQQAHTFLRCARIGSTVVIDLGRLGSAECVVITSDGWTVKNSWPDGVVFDRRSKSLMPLPDPSPTGNLEDLQQVLGLSHEQWLLVKGWLVASVLADISRPLLSLVGTNGSAKTTRGRFILSVLDPVEALGASFGRNERDDEVKASNRYLIGFDNVSRYNQTTNDFVCRLVSGDRTERRALYSDGDSHVTTYKRTGIITSRLLPAFEEDGMERLIPIFLERIVNNFRSEDSLRELFTALHPSILGGLCTAVSDMLKGLESMRDEDRVFEARWADYYQALYAYDLDCARVYLENTEIVMKHMADEDPFIQRVKAWLMEEGFKYRGTPTDAFKAISEHRQEEDLEWWPKNSRVMSQALSNKILPLKAAGITFAVRYSNSLRYWVFEMDKPKPKSLPRQVNRLKRVRAAAKKAEARKPTVGRKKAGGESHKRRGQTDQK